MKTKVRVHRRMNDKTIKTMKTRIRVHRRMNDKRNKQKAQSKIIRNINYILFSLLVK